jgi:hypothetical protein
MKDLHFEIEIFSEPEKVWEAVVDEAKYSVWTSAFCEGSRFEGGWNKGDKILFFAGDEEKKNGMISEIAESDYPNFISIRHLGMLVDGVEDFESAEVKKWTPAYENYTFEKLDGGKTLFRVDQNMSEEHAEMMAALWEKALKKLKEVCES